MQPHLFHNQSVLAEQMALNKKFAVVSKIPYGPELGGLGAGLGPDGGPPAALIVWSEGCVSTSTAAASQKPHRRSRRWVWTASLLDKKPKLREATPAHESPSKT